MRPWLLVALGIVALQAVVLYLFGQPLVCDCGIKLWEGVVESAGTSQQFTDWYTFSHIIHGFIFYALLTALFPRLSVGARFALAVGVEVGWEIAENTPMVIEHYRQQALARGYMGDSILNSVMDTLAMALGFLMARKLPAMLIIGLIFVFEAFVLYSIRDGLALNVLNLLHQFPAIEAWQAAGQ